MSSSFDREFRLLEGRKHRLNFDFSFVSHSYKILLFWINSELSRHHSRLRGCHRRFSWNLINQNYSLGKIKVLNLQVDRPNCSSSGKKRPFIYLTFNKCAILITLMYTKWGDRASWGPLREAIWGCPKCPREAPRSLMFFFVTKSRLAPCWYSISIVTHGALNRLLCIFFFHDKFAFAFLQNETSWPSDCCLRKNSLFLWRVRNCYLFHINCDDNTTKCWDDDKSNGWVLPTELKYEENETKFEKIILSFVGCISLPNTVMNYPRFFIFKKVLLTPQTINFNKKQWLAKFSVRNRQAHVFGKHSRLSRMWESGKRHRKRIPWSNANCDLLASTGLFTFRWGVVDFLLRRLCRGLLNIAALVSTKVYIETFLSFFETHQLCNSRSITGTW